MSMLTESVTRAFSVIKVDPAINSDDSRTEDISELLREVQSDFSASPAKAKTASSSNMLDEDSFDADDLNL